MGVLYYYNFRYIIKFIYRELLQTGKRYNRGGNYNNNGSNNPVSNRNNNSETNSNDNKGFAVSL